MLNFKDKNIKTPCYIIDKTKLTNNLEILHEVKQKASCKILLAQKAFSMYHFYPLIKKYLDGTAASGLFEAKLGHEEMGKETHTFSAAFTPSEMDEILKNSTHIIFNSFNEWEKYKDKTKIADVSAGIRINPEISTQENAIYDPCSPYSRLGVTKSNFKLELLDGIEGLHFHTLCEQNADALSKTLEVVEKNFGDYIKKMKWINFGGGHHITRRDYDRELLVKLITDFKNKYNIEVYLEPGEAIALDAGYLVGTVLDVVKNEKEILILDTSAACHMPDVIEMPYRPRVINAGEAGEKKHSYILAGATCLAGDIIGEYSFDVKKKNGDKIIFEDMAIYTMVKNNTFNGMRLPDIAVCDTSGNISVIKEFGYSDFKSRL